METLTFLGAVFLPLSTAAAFTAILPKTCTGVVWLFLGITALIPLAFYTMKWFRRQTQLDYDQAMEKISLGGFMELTMDLGKSLFQSIKGKKP